jgi:hypothetical protein
VLDAAPRTPRAVHRPALRDWSAKERKGAQIEARGAAIGLGPSLFTGATRVESPRWATQYPQPVAAAAPGRRGRVLTEVVQCRRRRRWSVVAVAVGGRWSVVAGRVGGRWSLVAGRVGGRWSAWWSVSAVVCVCGGLCLRWSVSAVVCVCGGSVVAGVGSVVAGRVGGRWLGRWSLVGS